MIERPTYCTEEMLVFLDNLRASGNCNMFGAGTELIFKFYLSREVACAILVYWMATFGERHGTA
jgi:hypothetical protein